MFSLSYIIATRNRLPFLKITLETLIGEVQPDEEIIVVDGNSTDGAKEYLQQLFDEGKINQFISEPDYNQAHAWNKGFLMANGCIIKKIIDDDVYGMKAIRQCKNFMLSNPDIDICLSNVLVSNIVDFEKVEHKSDLMHFNIWKEGKINSFPFGDVHTLVRKSSLSFLGLYDTQLKMMDWEYSLRATFLKAKIAYYTGYNALAAYTPGNVSSTATKSELDFEGKIGKFKYKYTKSYYINFYSRIKIFAGKLLAKILEPPPADHISVIPEQQVLENIYLKYYKNLDDLFSDADYFVY